MFEVFKLTEGADTAGKTGKPIVHAISYLDERSIAGTFRGAHQAAPRFAPGARGEGFRFQNRRKALTAEEN